MSQKQNVLPCPWNEHILPGSCNRKSSMPWVKDCCTVQFVSASWYGCITMKGNSLFPNHSELYNFQVVGCIPSQAHAPVLAASWVSHEGIPPRSHGSPNQSQSQESTWPLAAVVHTGYCNIFPIARPHGIPAFTIHAGFKPKGTELMPNLLHCSLVGSRQTKIPLHATAHGQEGFHTLACTAESLTPSAIILSNFTGGDG